MLLDNAREDASVGRFSSRIYDWTRVTLTTVTRGNHGVSEEHGVHVTVLLT
jgi:hypothetical protein